MLTYTVDLTLRAQHLLQVTLSVPPALLETRRLSFAAWTPGSYTLRHYSRHVQAIDATDAAGRQIPLVLDDLNHWRLADDADLSTNVSGPVDIRVELYANDLSVRTNHVDDHHALIIPAATFPTVEGCLDQACSVRFTGLGDDDRVFSLLPDHDGVFVADDYLHLVDSAFEVGALPSLDFEIDGVAHQFVWSGHGPPPALDKIADDVRAISRVATEVFGGDLPMRHYTMLCAGWDHGGGGLEHRDGAVLQMPVGFLEEDDTTRRFQSLLAHEYFHAWNVKRLTPQALVAPDLTRAALSPSLWVAEGWTAYYDKLLPARAGLWQPDYLLEQLGEVRQRINERAASDVHSLRDASSTAWTRFYVRDENSPNGTVDYYGQGALAAFEIDLRLRALAPTSRGLDDVCTQLWERHAETLEGYTEDDVLAAIATVGGEAVAAAAAELAGQAIRPRVDDERLEAIGLRTAAITSRDTTELGVVITEADTGVTISSVLRGRAAWRAGVSGGDQLIAIEGATVSRGNLPRILRRFVPGQTIAVSVRRGPRLLTLPVTLDEPQTRTRLVRVAEPTAAQRTAFNAWCGLSIDDLPPSAPAHQTSAAN